MQNKKYILIISIAVVLLLSGVVIYLISRVRHTEQEMMEMVEMASYEKEQLENEYTDMALEVEGQMLKINNDSIFKLLEKEQKRVQLLLEELRTVKVTNARRIAELKEELASVRKVTKYYIAQVDSLNRVNEVLKQENIQVREQMSLATKTIDTLMLEKDKLSKTVRLASQLEAKDMSVVLLNDKGRKTKYVRKVDNIKVDFTIAKNITTDAGQKVIYLRIATPDGQVLMKNDFNKFVFEDKEIAFSSKKEIEYSGEDLPCVIYYKVTETLIEGKYRADLFVDGHLIGTEEFIIE
ncbi:MAG: hypothetical protein PUC14_04290 [Bacteroidales bacterium]|nr:hypothetical protein [Bacteroidales bacterium]MDD5974932.1 hypothetical protein [Bacteroidales bacterium]MDY5194378.1 hypothetical protein [Candidatus Aphodosoma sp.]